MLRRYPHQRFAPLPRLWLMTDERQGDDLWKALNRLPQGSGVIFRHYSLGERTRKAIFAKIRVIARRRRLLLLVAGPPRLARAWQADGFHARMPGIAYPELVHSVPTHNARELHKAQALGADIALLSPVYATRSHPGSAPLGTLRFGIALRGARLPVIALGGMNARRARAMNVSGVYGWAAIDGLTPNRIRT